MKLKNFDQLQSIFAFLFEQKIKLVNFKREEPSLEDAFIELTRRRVDMGVLVELEKIWYFMKRDVVSFSTYKTNIAVLVFTAIFGALTFAYLGQSSVNQTVTTLYHVPYTTYLLIGLAFNSYLGQALTLVQKTINPWSLEEVLVSPTRLTTFIIGSSIFGFIWSSGVVAVFLLIGVYCFRGSVKHQRGWNPDCVSVRDWHIHRNQHDRLWHTHFN